MRLDTSQDCVVKIDSFLFHVKMKMIALKLLVVFYFGQVSSLPKANHLVVSGTNHTHLTQVNFEERCFDGVFEVVEDPTEFFGVGFNKTVYKRLNDPDNDIHIIVPVLW